MLWCHDDAADYLGLGIAGCDAGEIDEELAVGVCDECEVRIVACCGVSGKLDAYLFLLRLVVHNKIVLCLMQN